MNQPRATPARPLVAQPFREAGTRQIATIVHGPDERVMVDEVAESTLAVADRLGRLARTTPEEA